MAHIVDSYSEANKTGNYALDSGDDWADGQSFTGDGSVLNSAKFYLSKNNSPTGNATVKVYAETHTIAYGTDSIPTGSALAASATFNVATLTGSFQLITFTFSGANKITLGSGTHYVVTCEYNGGNTSNYVKYAESSTLSHAGNLAYTGDGLTWTPDTTRDSIFYVYGDDTTTPQTILGKSSIKVTTTKTITGKSAIVNPTKKTILGKSNIRANTQKTITGTSLIVQYQPSIWAPGTTKSTTYTKPPVVSTTYTKSTVSSTKWIKP
jgi:hypothetical protein